MARDKALKILNFAVLLQQQRYIVAISYLFYLSNGLTLSDFLFFQSIFYFTGLIAEIPAGYIGDIFPRKNILIFSYLLFTLRIVMWIIIPNYYTILFGEILYGLSKAFYRGVSDGYIYDYLKENNVTNLMINKYGKFNFFMSTGSAVSCLLGTLLYKHLGFYLLLGIELFCNSAAIITLLFLPQIKHTPKKISLSLHLKKLFGIVKSTVQNSSLSYFILYSGILSGITSIFVWNFQPTMKHFMLPVSIFGIIYFINHMLRAICSMKSDSILKYTNLPNLGCFVWMLYILAFISLISLLKFGNSILCIACLIFVCIAIGIQMSFNVGNLSRIHRLVESDTRATVSSINSMLTSLFSGLFLMIFKSIIDSHTSSYALSLFLFVFILTIFILKKIHNLYFKTS